MEIGTPQAAAPAGHHQWADDADPVPDTGHQVRHTPRDEVGDHLGGRYDGIGENNQVGGSGTGTETADPDVRMKPSRDVRERGGAIPADIVVVEPGPDIGLADDAVGCETEPGDTGTGQQRGDGRPQPAASVNPERAARSSGVRRDTGGAHRKAGTVCGALGVLDQSSLSEAPQHGFEPVGVLAAHQREKRVGTSSPVETAQDVHQNRREIGGDDGVTGVKTDLDLVCPTLYDGQPRAKARASRQRYAGDDSRRRSGHVLTVTPSRTFRTRRKRVVHRVKHLWTSQGDAPL